MIRRRAARLAGAAALIAVLAGVLPIDPVAPLARAAAPNLTIAGDAQYVVLPDARLVRVSVDLTAVNHLRDTKTRRYFFERAFLAVMPGTTGFKVAAAAGTPGKPAVRVAARRKDSTLLRIDFGGQLGSGKTARYRLTFDLPDPGGAATRQVRVGPSLATFPVWAFASDGTPGGSVSVTFPAGYEVDVSTGNLPAATTAADGSVVLQSGRLASPLAFFAYLVATRPTALVETTRDVKVGDRTVRLRLRAWPEDPDWAKRTGDTLAAALPALSDAIGLPWTGSDSLTVEESLGDELAGTTGSFEPADDRLRLAYHSGPWVALDQAAHAWFDGELVGERWAAEGFATWYARQAAAAAKIAMPAPPIGGGATPPEPAPPRMPLNAWNPTGDIEPAADARARADADALAAAIAERAGPEGLAGVWEAARTGVAAYQPPVDPDAPTSTDAVEAGAPTPDWRGLLDLVEAETGRPFEDLWRGAVVRSDEAGLLDERAAARDHYDAVVDRAADWQLPRSVRNALRAWQFGTAEEMLAAADSVLDDRDAIAADARAVGLTPPGALETAFEGRGGFAAAADEAESELAAIDRYASAAAASRNDRGPLGWLGLLGAQPGVQLEAARSAFAAGDLAASVAASDAARTIWTTAADVGRNRLLALLAGGAALLLAVSLVVGKIRSRATVTAAVIALLVVLLPAGSSPARAADDGLDIATSATYRLDPDAEAVHVAVDLRLTNRRPPTTRSTPSGPQVTDWVFDGFTLPVQESAARLRASFDGARLTTSLRPADGFAVARVSLRRGLRFEQTTSVRLTFDLPGGAPRSRSEVRVGRAFAAFEAWAFGDRGSVRIELPSKFEEDVSGASLERSTEGGSTVLAAAGIDDPTGWFATVVARRDDALTNDRIDLRTGEHLVIRAWPDDTVWQKTVRETLEQGTPILRELIGLSWPVSGDLTVSEVHTPLLEGYAGIFYGDGRRIDISEDLDSLTIVHELSHAWFNGDLFRERWINEGLADEYASRVLDRMGDSGWDPLRVAPSDAAAVALNGWSFPGRIADRETQAREQFGYEASWTVMRQLVDSVGEEGMRRVFAAAGAGALAYIAEDRFDSAGDQAAGWRRFLDLLEEAGGSDRAEAIFRAWVATDVDLATMDRRHQAREDYAALAEAGADWAVPLGVREAMGGWSFDVAGDRMEAARAVLEARDELGAAAGAAGLTVPAGEEGSYETARQDADLARVEAGLDRQLAAVRAIGEADAAVSASRDPFLTIGLIGEQPSAALDEARSLFESNEPDRAVDRADALRAMLASAPEAGRTRSLAAGGGLLALLLLLALAGYTIRRRMRSSGRPKAEETGPEASPSYATLAATPDGDAAAPPEDGQQDGPGASVTPMAPDAPAGDGGIVR
jgi:hypothetical protein